MALLENTLLAWALITTFGIWTHLFWHHNRFFKVVESVGIGITMGNFVVSTTKTIGDNTITPLFDGNYILIVPLILGMLLLFQLSKEYMWVARTGMAFIVGVGIAVNVYGTVGSDVQGSILRTFLNLTTGDPLTIFGNILSVIMFISTLAYFLFGREHTGAYGQFTRLGRLSMMVAFGVALGGLIWFRNALTEARIVWVLEALGLI